MSEQKHILVVDDEEELREVLKDKLEAVGFKVTTATNGEEALDVVFTARPDLLLLDLIMPKVGGFEVLSKLKEDEWGKNVPVILLTNLDDYRSLASVLEKKGHEYLVKTDWKIDDIVEKIKTKLA